jgi:hypothetical protein
MTEHIRQIFFNITSIRRAPINAIGGVALGFLFAQALPEKRFMPSFFIGFFAGFIYMNSLIKEPRVVSLKGMYYRLFIIIVALMMLLGLIYLKA